ncbi:hypothetical protein ASE63_12635 [Bosea sp. Root381]|uniref:c-type cytochrome n=1 Tax=Bosea sp. Root381 TaxID=1736524 RepID=UPI0006F8413A|nr:c-type cytochrome [Bosea sp. Root381]KRD95855.1 hypothetical protein ASE63_12635 [Bosea sp. Root381]
MALLERARHGARWLLASRRRSAGGLALAVLAIAGGGFLFAWTGAYNIAASRGHFAVVEHMLRFGMVQSVRARAPTGPVPDLTDPSLISLGAAHFEAGCAYCHGAPGRPISAVVRGMLPTPPDLADLEGKWRDGELFWIVKHGIKYTGMPGWPELERDDEIWAVVAFLRRFPGLDRLGYEKLARGEVEIPPGSGAEIAVGETPADAAGACARCHGAGNPPVSELVPRLHGQPAAMLETALRDYASGQRQSGIMQFAANSLSEDEIRRLAGYYAKLPPLPARPVTADAETIARGERLAQEGDAGRDIPACLSCHSAAARPDYPRLAGQPARYLEGQLRLRQRGLNQHSATGAIMAPVARHLSEADIVAASAYFASRSLQSEARR